MEDSSFYETIDEMSDTCDSDVEHDSVCNNGCIEGNGNKNKNRTGKSKQVMSQILIRERHFVIIQKRWKTLYDVREAVRLQEAVKIHLFKNKFGEDAVHHDKINPDFDPLAI
jgi:hypothetical protein